MADSRFAFDALLKKIEPTPERVGVVKDLHAEVREWLEDHEYETRAPHTRLIGSYARHTAICDIKDVDVLESGWGPAHMKSPRENGNDHPPDWTAQRGRPASSEAG